MLLGLALTQLTDAPDGLGNPRLRTGKVETDKALKVIL
jgi:hypothetical protein